MDCDITGTEASKVKMINPETGEETEVDVLVSQFSDEEGKQVAAAAYTFQEDNIQLIQFIKYIGNPNT